MLPVIVMALSLGACGGATPATEGENEQGGASASGGGDGTVAPSDDALTEAPRCPERYGLAPRSCDAGDAPGVCNYPEGTCRCGVPTWCGGAAPPPMPVTWICETPPTTACGAPGTPCTGAASCSVGPCGFDSIACVDGVWTSRIGPRPP